MSRCRMFLFLGFCFLTMVGVPRANAIELSQENANCLMGTWSAREHDTKAASLGIQFDGKGRVWVTLAPDAVYIPSGFKLPIVRDLEFDSSAGKLFFSLPNSGRFYLEELENDDLLVIRADNSSILGGEKSKPQINDTKFSRTSLTLSCAVAPKTDPTALAQSNAESDDYSASQLFDGFGAIFIAVGEPVLFPIERAKTCKAESGSDANASGCAALGFLVSPFLVIRDALVGLGDVVTGGYFKLSRKSGVFEYFEKK